MHLRLGRSGQLGQHLGDGAESFRRVLFQCPGNHTAVRFDEHRHVGLRGQVFHQHLTHAFPFERHTPGEQFEQDNAQGVYINLFTVAPVGHLGRHVVDGAHAFCLTAAPAARDEFRQPVIADLHHALVAEDVPRLEIAVNDTVIVQTSHAGDDPADPGQGLVDGQSVGTRCDDLLEAIAVDVLHDDPVVTPLVFTEVEDRQKVRVFQIQALLDAAQLDIEITPDQLQGHLFAGVAGGEINFAKPPAADPAFDRIAGQWR